MVTDYKMAASFVVNFPGEKENENPEQCTLQDAFVKFRKKRQVFNLANIQYCSMTVLPICLFRKSLGETFAYLGSRNWNPEEWMSFEGSS
jgi:hypothetical protein